MVEFRQKMAKIGNFRRFLGIGVSATLAEYSVPNIRPILTEYSAEYSVFGRTLDFTHTDLVLICYNALGSPTL